MIVSFTGAQSTGKTTLINECSKFPITSTECLDSKWCIVPEVTRLVRRNFNVNINEAGNDDTQLLILAQHLANTHVFKDKNVIMDRCVVDGLVYTRYLYSQDKVSYDVKAHAEFMFDKLISKLHVIFYTSPEDIPLEDDGERSVDIAFRDNIIAEFEDILYYIEQQYGNMPVVVRLKGSIQERIEQVREMMIDITGIIDVDHGWEIPKI
jgi:predicted ATPase